MVCLFAIIVATGINRLHDHCRDQTFTIIIAIDQIVRDHCCDRIAGLWDLHCRRTCSFVIIVTIESARLRNLCRRRTCSSEWLMSRSNFQFVIVFAIKVIISDHHRDWNYSFVWSSLRPNCLFVIIIVMDIRATIVATELFARATLVAIDFWFVINLCDQSNRSRSSSWPMNSFVCEHPRDQCNCSRSSSWTNLIVHATIIAIELALAWQSSRLRHLLTIIVAADLAHSYHCNYSRSWTEQ